MLACVFALCIGKLDKFHVKFVRNSYEFRTNFCEFHPICSFCSCIASCPLPLSQFVPGTPPHICMQVLFTAWSPNIRHHTRRKYKPRPRLPEEHAEPAESPGGDQLAGTGGGQAPSEAGSVRSEGSQRFRRSGGSEASTARAHVAREVVVPQPSRDELGDAHNDPPLD